MRDLTVELSRVFNDLPRNNHNVLFYHPRQPVFPSLCLSVGQCMLSELYGHKCSISSFAHTYPGSGNFRKFRHSQHFRHAENSGSIRTIRRTAGVAGNAGTYFHYCWPNFKTAGNTRNHNSWQFRHFRRILAIRRKCRDCWNSTISVICRKCRECWNSTISVIC